MTTVWLLVWHFNCCSCSNNKLNKMASVYGSARRSPFQVRTSQLYMSQYKLSHKNRRTIHIVRTGQSTPKRLVFLYDVVIRDVNCCFKTEYKKVYTGLPLASQNSESCCWPVCQRRCSLHSHTPATDEKHTRPLYLFTRWALNANCFQEKTTNCSDLNYLRDAERRLYSKPESKSTFYRSVYSWYVNQFYARRAYIAYSLNFEYGYELGQPFDTC